MKIPEKLLRVALGFLILLSLFFTYSIWVSPAGNVSSLDSGKNVVQSEQNYAKATDAFLPIRGIWNIDGDHFQTNSENLLATAQARLTEGTYGELELVADNEEKMIPYYLLSHGVELNYEGPFSLAEYVKVFDMPLNLEHLKDSQQILFNKIQIDFGDQKIRFLNFRKHLVYQADLSLDFKQIGQLYAENPQRFLPMTTDQQLIPRLLQTKEVVRLKKYSYILTTQTYSLFRNAFFQDPEQARGEEEDNGARSFISGQEEMVMDEEKRTVTFNGKLADDLQNQSLYNQSFSYVSRLGTAVGNLRYFDRQNNQINYRIFVEGYPIFSQSSKGKMTVSIEEDQGNSNNKVQISTSMDTVQVPIPSEEEVELPSSAVMEGNLQAVGIDLSLLQSYIIGYTWQDVDGVNKVVALTPEWYVKYNDQWYPARELMQGPPEMEAS
ncbi:hypothetical protein NRIC_31400 [Enterococcus florum]|uniref:Regulatory protein YycH domain-containing protein n=1 Tax=Enterococcus florum TaxID=2480627 RepID=A0A4V0WPW2_9ENTE|nr:two-component system activity regulator YycH [Enterococcus florum]GCF95249.1 hypothetical protein NRIC_31400 [Enterococcus florum]